MIQLTQDPHHHPHYKYSMRGQVEGGHRRSSFHHSRTSTNRFHPFQQMKTNQFTRFALDDPKVDSTIYPEILSASLAVAECGLCGDLAVADIISLKKESRKSTIQRHNRKTKKQEQSKSNNESNFPSVFGAVFGVTQIECLGAFFCFLQWPSSFLLLTKVKRAIGHNKRTPFPKHFRQL